MEREMGKERARKESEGGKEREKDSIEKDWE